jgi:hypothetical protein
LSSQKQYMLARYSVKLYFTRFPVCSNARLFHIFNIKRHSDDEGEDYHNHVSPNPNPTKKRDFMSKLPPIMPPNDPRIYQPTHIPEPNEENTIRAVEREEHQKLTPYQFDRLEIYYKRLQELISLAQTQRMNQIQVILDEMLTEGLRPNERITHVVNLLQLNREESIEEKTHRNSKPTTKKQSDPDFFEPLREKQQNVKTVRHSQETIDHIFKTRGMSHEKYKQHLREEESKRRS